MGDRPQGEDERRRHPLRPSGCPTRRRLPMLVAQLLAATTLLANAQEAPPGPAAVELEKVRVTGSNIARPEAASMLPIQVITRQDIERSGSTDTSELMGK